MLLTQTTRQRTDRGAARSAGWSRVNASRGPRPCGRRRRSGATRHAPPRRMDRTRLPRVLHHRHECRGGRDQHEGDAGTATTLDHDIACMPCRRAFLLQGLVVFVDDDRRSHACTRRPGRRARADHHVDTRRCCRPVRRASRRPRARPVESVPSIVPHRGRGPRPGSVRVRRPTNTAGITSDEAADAARRRRTQQRVGRREFGEGADRVRRSSGSVATARVRRRRHEERRIRRAAHRPTPTAASSNSSARGRAP